MRAILKYVFLAIFAILTIILWVIPVSKISDMLGKVVGEKNKTVAVLVCRIVVSLITLGLVIYVASGMMR